jgi:predicted PurR-regulated permease PerM
MKHNPMRQERNIAVVVLMLLLIGCLVVMRPFVSALLWAVVLCFSVWPVYEQLVKWVRHRHPLAAGIMTLAITLILLMPFVIIGLTLADNVQEFVAATRKWLDAGLPGPPEWVEKIPAIGSAAADSWRELVQDSALMLERLNQFIEPVSAWLLKGGLALGRGLLELALSILIAFFLFRDGVRVGDWVQAAVARLAGERGAYLLGVAGSTVRGVVYGILGTALVQAMVAGIGFLIAGVPGAMFLALLTFFLSVVPVGPPLVWIPAAIWLFQHRSPGWGIFMIVWGLIVSSVDNVVKPVIISQGSRMPFILIFFGVLGGALAFGFIGVFLGPTLLAVGYRLIAEWAKAAKPELQVPPEEEPGFGEGEVWP